MENETITRKGIEEAAEEYSDLHSLHDIRHLCDSLWNEAKILYTKILVDFAKFLGKQEKDVEGDDEMLYVSRKKLQYFYEKLRKVGENHAAFALQSLFGSKCLPDELNKDNFAKPEHKFKRGDKVMVKPYSKECVVESYNPDTKEYCLDCGGNCVAYRTEQYLEPYTEPKENF